MSENDDSSFKGSIQTLLFNMLRSIKDNTNVCLCVCGGRAGKSAVISDICGYGRTEAVGLVAS